MSSVGVNQQQLDSLYRRLDHIKKGAPKAIVRAINHELKVTRTESSVEIRKQVKLKAGYVRQKLALNKANPITLSGSISTPTRGMLLTNYSHIAYKRGGVGVQVKPTGGKQKMPGAFLMTFPNGRTGVMIRTKKGPGLGRSEGLKVLYGPSASQVFTDVKDQLQTPASNRLQQRLNHEATQLLQGR